MPTTRLTKQSNPLIADTSMSAAAAYLDGACSGNPGPGGWGTVVVAMDGTSREFSGNEDMTTNNRMELMAAVVALECLPHPCKIRLYTASKHVSEGVEKRLSSWVENRWRTSSGTIVKNVDLWKRIAVAVDGQEVDCCHSNQSNNVNAIARVEKLAKSRARAHHR